MASNPRPKIKSTSLKRTTLDTRFFIDFGWWERSNLDLRTYLLSRFSLGDENSLEAEFDQVDLVDSRTGEVHQVDGFQYLIQSYFHRLPEDFITHASDSDLNIFETYYYRTFSSIDCIYFTDNPSTVKWTR